MGEIQRALGLQDEKLWTRIRDSATKLLKDAEILLQSATDSTVQVKKWAAADNLEKLYPDVFGVVAGKSRDQAVQKDTSYAIMTSAMDMAKREQKKKQSADRQSSKPHVARGRPPLTGLRKHKSMAGVSQPSQPSPSPSEFKLLPSTRTPATFPDPIAMEDLVLILTLNSTVGNIYSPMPWPDLIPQGDNSPKLVKVRDNLAEDGLRLEKDSYTIYDSEGHAVRSDRCLNYLLKRYAGEGVQEILWKIVPDGTLLLRRL